MVNNFWQNFKRDFLAYSRSDRNAIIIVAFLIIVVLVINEIVKSCDNDEKYDFTEIKAFLDEWESGDSEDMETIIFFDFDPNTISQKQLDSMSIPSFIKQNLIKFRNAGGVFKKSNDVYKLYGMNDSIFALIEKHIKITSKAAAPLTLKKIKRSKLTGFFDPNTVSPDSLLQFGFSVFQANNLLNYRNKGGFFSAPSDLLKIYGVDSVFYSQVYKCIKIKAEKPISEPVVIVNIELNSADSASLVQLRGVGPVFAKRIIKYRNMLGGFCQKQQLLEVYNFSEEQYRQIEANINIDTTKIVALRINFATYTDLIKHPYLNKTQVKALLRYRDSNGAFTNVSELQQLEGFDKEVIVRVGPYLSCR